MDEKNASPLILYVPDFFASLTGKAIPVEVKFMLPGLPVQNPATGLQHARYVPSNLPLSPADAKKCLDELLQLGETHAGNLTERVLREDFTPPENLGSAELSRGEAADLASFAATGDAPAPKPQLSDEEQARRRLIGAQKMLLMGYSLEKSIVEANSLIASTEKVYTDLAKNLGGKRHDLNLGTTSDLARPDWSRMFGAMLRFMPEGAYFYTVHDDIEALLHDDDEPLKNLTGEEAARLFPVSSRKGWEFAQGEVKVEPFTGADGTVTVIVPVKYGS